MTTAPRAPLAEQASAALLARIRSGEWALGAKLPGETTLAPQLGVGRSTLREAIRHLAGLGVLSTRQGSGVFVTSLEVAEDWDTVLHRSDIVSIIEARIAIEGEAAVLATERGTDADVALIREALAHRDRERSGDAEALVDADTAFHRSIVAAAHNPILLDLFDTLTPRLRQAMVRMLRIRRTHGGDADHASHIALTDAIAARDPEGARTLSRSHLESLREDLA